MKEAEIDDLAMPWVNARVAHLLSVCRATTERWVMALQKNLAQMAMTR